MGVFVPIRLVLPKCEATNLGVFDLCHFAVLKRGCANSVVGLELAEISFSQNTRGFAKGWFPKGWFWRMFPSTKNRHEGTFGCCPVPKTGTFGCSPEPKTGTMAHSPKPPLTKQPFCFLSQNAIGACDTYSMLGREQGT